MAITDKMKFDAMPLKQAYLTSGRTYQQIASIFSCTVATVHNVINGITPRSKFLPAIAAELGVDVSECWKVMEGAA